MNTVRYIIEQFNTYTGFGLDLNEDDKMRIFNSAYTQFLTSRDWNFLKSYISLPITDNTITVPVDFRKVAFSGGFTGDFGAYIKVGDTFFTYVSTANTLYRDTTYIAWKEGDKIKFSQPVSGNATFVYTKNPTILTIEDSIIDVPSLSGAILYKMLVESPIIDEADKQRTYLRQYQDRLHELETAINNYDINNSY